MKIDLNVVDDGQPNWLAEIARQRREAERAATLAAARRRWLDERKAAMARDKAFNEDQPRDENGRFASTGSSGGGDSGDSGDSGGQSISENLRSDKLFTESERSLPDKVAQAATTKESLYEQAAAEKKTFDKGLNTGQGVDKAIGAKVVRPTTAEEFNAAIGEPGPAVIIAGLKGAGRAEEKVQNKYGGDWSRLTDVVRATVAVESKDEIPGAVDALRKEMGDRGWEIAAKPDNRIENPTPAGYRDLNLLFRSPNGHVAEVQVNTKAMIRAKQGDGHKLYEEYRSLEEPIRQSGREPTPEESAKLTELSSRMSQIYKEAWSK